MIRIIQINLNTATSMAKCEPLSGYTNLIFWRFAWQEQSAPPRSMVQDFLQISFDDLNHYWPFKPGDRILGHCAKTLKYKVLKNIPAWAFLIATDDMTLAKAPDYTYAKSLTDGQLFKSIPINSLVERDENVILDLSAAEGLAAGKTLFIYGCGASIDYSKSDILHGSVLFAKFVSDVSQYPFYEYIDTSLGPYDGKFKIHLPHPWEFPLKIGDTFHVGIVLDGIAQATCAAWIEYGLQDSKSNWDWPNEELGG